jgi:hypothetical protein
MSDLCVGIFDPLRANLFAKDSISFDDLYLLNFLYF